MGDDDLTPPEGYELIPIGSLSDHLDALASALAGTALRVAKTSGVAASLAIPRLLVHLDELDEKFSDIEQQAQRARRAVYAIKQGRLMP